MYIHRLSIVKKKTLDCLSVYIANLTIDITSE